MAASAASTFLVEIDLERSVVFDFEGLVVIVFFFCDDIGGVVSVMDSYHRGVLSVAVFNECESRGLTVEDYVLEHYTAAAL